MSLVFGKRKWAWPVSLPSSYQMAGLGDGLFFEANESFLLCSNFKDSHLSSCLQVEYDGSEYKMGVSKERNRRRDSEGYILDGNALPWNQI